jgi:hypothetical protein
MEKSTTNKVYAFYYNCNIHESVWATMSLHYSKEGAEKAMQEHKQKELEQFNKNYSKRSGVKFGQHEDWHVGELDILP